MITEKNRDEVQLSENVPCAVCGRGVGVSSGLSSICDKWYHTRCSDVVGSFSIVKIFVCRRCKGLSAGNIKHVYDCIQQNCGPIEEVKCFCYLDYTLKCD